MKKIILLFSYNSRLICLFFLNIIFLVGLILTIAWFCGYRVNTTSSLPRGLYQLTQHPPQRGDTVFFCLESQEFINLAISRGYIGLGTCPGGIRALGKEIFGIPGDLVSIEANGLISLNDQAIPGSAPMAKDSKGRLMPPSALQKGKIQKGKALTLSLHNPGSFDSRYFGLVNLSGLTPVRPVLVFN